MFWLDCNDFQCIYFQKIQTCIVVSFAWVIFYFTCHPMMFWEYQVLASVFLASSRLLLLISEHRKLLGVPGWGTYLRVWVSKGSHRVVLGRKFTCSLQGKCSMIDTSDIVILSHIKRGVWIFIGIHTKKVQTTDHPWRVKSQPEIHWINGTYCWWFRNPAKPRKYWDKLPTSTGDRWMMVHPSQRSHRLNAHEHPMGHLGWKERWVGRWMDFLELF